MDAKPYRPPRPLVAANNENFPMPPTKQSHNIHQRYKSTGSLRNQSTLPTAATTTTHAGALQGPAKRAVFADKSNTARNSIAYDEGKMANAKFLVAKTKENANSTHGVQKDALLRPAQRPSSRVGSLLPSASTGHMQPLAGAPTRAVVKLNKKASTIVFQDNNSRPSTSGSASNVTQHIEIADGPGCATTSSAQLPRKPRHYQSQPALKTTQQKQQQSASLLDTNIKNLTNWEPLTAERNPSEEDVTQTPYLDAVEELSPEQYPVQSHDINPSIGKRKLLPPPVPALRADHSHQDGQYPEERLISPTDLLEPSDHEDEDFYEVDQGYTTTLYHSGGEILHSDVGGHPETEPELSMTMTVMDMPYFSKQVLDEIDAAREHVEKNRSPDEFEDELWDISMVAEYGDEIFEYMKEMEAALLPSPHYMDIQTEIQWSMRSVLMDWIIQVHGRFNLLPETLFLAVNFVDRFLSVKVVSLGKLQLVGATAIFLAAKYEEINCPSVQEIVYMVDSGYSVDEILKAERYMLSMLDFNLGFPGPMSFLRRISKADDYDLETRTLAKYFLEVTVMDERFVASPPSFLAAGSHCLSRLILEKGDWTPEHVHYSGYTFSQLQPLISMILECCTIAEKHHQAVLDKYSDKRFKKCATYVKSQLKSGWYLEAPQAVFPALDVRYESFPYSWGSTPAPYGRPDIRMPIPMQG